MKANLIAAIFLSIARTSGAFAADWIATINGEFDHSGGCRKSSSAATLDHSPCTAIKQKKCPGLAVGAFEFGYSKDRT